MGLHAVIKREFFTFIFTVFLPNYVIPILALVRWLRPSGLTELYMWVPVYYNGMQNFTQKQDYHSDVVIDFWNGSNGVTGFMYITLDMMALCA